MTCTCDSIGATPEIRFCDGGDGSHHRYFFGDKELTSVSKVIADVWPVKPSWENVNPDVVNNARDRGVVTDRLFSAWVVGKLEVIPAETRQDAVDRFLALTEWWEANPFGGDLDVSTQEIVYDDEIAGTIDIAINSGRLHSGGIYLWDIKNTASLESTHTIKLGAYVDMYQRQHGVKVSGCGDIQVTQAKGKPVKIRVVPYDVTEVVEEWRIVRDMWGLVRRKSALGGRS